MSELVALAGDAEVGRVGSSRGRLSFTYSDAWLEASPWRFPLSLSMPLTSREHGNRIVHAYLSNLLPDNTDILRSWRARFGVRSQSPFALLEHVGEDCAGAIQYIKPARVEDLRVGTRSEVQWLSEREIGARLRQLKVNAAAWRLAGDLGQFSLSGAQPKTALLKRGSRWGIPSGRVPTTHILKPPSDQFPGHAENEHFCLTLGRRLGLRTALSAVAEFDGALAIVLERFDRTPGDNSVMRIHTEDLCQASGTPPDRKYEFEGGPGVAAISKLLRDASSARDEDLCAFADALIFNWLIAGTDAHAKNYSLLMGGRDKIRLAPLYDVASALGYAHVDQRAAKLAMRIGRYYRLDIIQARHWKEAAVHLKMASGQLQDRISGMTAAIPEAISDTARQLGTEGLRHPMVARLRDAMHARAEVCATTLRAR